MYFANAPSMLKPISSSRSQWFGQPSQQGRQAPHHTISSAQTGSPPLNGLFVCLSKAPAPASTTTPASSWPRVHGNPVRPGYRM